MSAAGSRRTGRPDRRRRRPRQVVHSPEQVALHFPLAGPTSRILAYAIDRRRLIWILELGALRSCCWRARRSRSWARRRLHGAPARARRASPRGERAALLGAAWPSSSWSSSPVEMALLPVLSRLATGGRSLGQAGPRAPRGARRRTARSGCASRWSATLLRPADMPARQLPGRARGDGDVAARASGSATSPRAPSWSASTGLARPNGRCAEVEDGSRFRFDRAQIGALGADGAARSRARRCGASDELAARGRGRRPSSVRSRRCGRASATAPSRPPSGRTSCSRSGT